MRFRLSIPAMIVLGAVCAILLSGTAWAAGPYKVDLREDVEYGTGGGEKLTLHLAVPQDVPEAAPGIVFIHGGGWAAGNKNAHKPHIKMVAEQGYVAASVGYRFAPKHPFPAQIEDCKCAVRYLRAHADEIGLDPARIGAIGFSAGAHLSMMLGTMDSTDGLEGNGGWQDQSSKVQCVVSYFGPVDLTNTSLEGLAAADTINEKAVRSILRNFAGGEPEEKADLLRQASPITYVNKGDAPTLMFQGTKDQLVPYDQAFQMATALTKAGIPGRVELILGANHGWFGPEMARTLDGTMAFFAEHLNNGKK